MMQRLGADGGRGHLVAELLHAFSHIQLFARLTNPPDAKTIGEEDATGAEA